MLEQFAQEVKESTNVHGLSLEGILELILSIMDICVDDEDDFTNSVRNPSLLQRAALRVVVRRHFGLRGRRNTVEVANNLLSAAQSLDDKALVSAYREGKGVFTPLDYIFIDEGN